MQSFKINTHYAKALFMLAEETGKTEQVAEDMRLVCRVGREHHLLGVVFANPNIKVAKKQAIIHDLFEGKVCDVTLAFLHYVMRKKRSMNTVGIGEAFLEQYRRSRGITLTRLTTAEPASDDIKRLVEQRVADFTHNRVELVTKEDSRIIGGLAMEFDNRMYDARISSMLLRLRQSFGHNVYESKL